MDDGLTPKYLSAILLEHYQAKRGEACECVTLKEVVDEAIGVGQGFLGCIKRLHLKWQGEDCATFPSSVIAKYPPAPNSEIFKQFFEPMQLMQRELLFYQRVSPLVSTKEWNECGVIPRLYHGDYDVDSAKGVLLLQDIHPAESIPLKNGISIPDAKAALTALATVHALYWHTMIDDPSSGVPESLRWLCSDSARDSFFGNLISNLSTEALPKLEQTLKSSHLPKEECDRIIQRCRELVPSIPAIMTLSSRNPRALALCHGDMWLNNILFKTDINSNERRSAVLLDWQFACVGSPLTDVCFFLVSSLDPDVRKRYNAELLEFYYGRIQERLGNKLAGYSAEMCSDDYTLEMGATLVQILSSIDIFLSPDEGIEPAQSLVRRLAIFFSEADYDAIIASVTQESEAN